MLEPEGIDVQTGTFHAEKDETLSEREASNENITW